MTDPDDLLAQALQDAYDRGFDDGAANALDHAFAPLTLADPEPATCGTDCDCLTADWEAAAKLGATQDANRARTVGDN